jgi:pimeloyl-ACP methyl ester carboxylesterase
VTPTVVLLHAFPLDPRMWDDVALALAADGIPVAAPRLGPEPSIEPWAGRILAETDGPLVPVGVSMGGYVTFELLRQGSDRIVGVGLVDTRPGADSPEGRAARDETIALLRAEGPAAVWERVGAKLLAPGAPREVVERARAIVLDQDAEMLAAQVAAMRDRRDATPYLPEIHVPALVVHGEEDATIPIAEAEATAEVLPNARLVPLPETGHLPPLERPAELTDAIRDLLAEVG